MPVSRSEKVAEFAQCVVPCRLMLTRLYDLNTQSERLNLETFSISKIPLSRPADNLLTNYSTRMLSLLPLASILLSGMHYFVWHSYHWLQCLILVLS